MLFIGLSSIINMVQVPFKATALMLILYITHQFFVTTPLWFTSFEIGVLFLLFIACVVMVFKKTGQM